MIGMGNQPIDDGQYLFTSEEKEKFLKVEPKASLFFKEFYGAKEFINQSPRYCLWLGDCSPAQLRKLPHCLERVERVRQFRLSSSRASTVKMADAPTRFQTENMPSSDYIVVPKVSSERRRYVPMGIMSPWDEGGKNGLANSGGLRHDTTSFKESFHGHAPPPVHS